MTEQWRSVVGLEGRYEVSDQGNVRSLRFRNGVTDALRPAPLLLRLRVGLHGYLKVQPASRTTAVHRLVLEAFVGPCPDGCEASHLNGVRADNRLVNLAWETRSENARRKDEHGTVAIGDRNGARRHPERLARGDRSGARLHPERWVRGEAHHHAKLTAAKVLEIRSAVARGVSQKRLAELYGLNRDTVLRIVHRESWAHVP